MPGPADEFDLELPRYPADLPEGVDASDVGAGPGTVFIALPGASCELGSQPGWSDQTGIYEGFLQ